MDEGGMWVETNPNPIKKAFGIKDFISNTPQQADKKERKMSRIVEYRKEAFEVTENGDGFAVQRRSNGKRVYTNWNDTECAYVCADVVFDRRLRKSIKMVCESMIKSDKRTANFESFLNRDDVCDLDTL